MKFLNRKLHVYCSSFYASHNGIYLSLKSEELCTIFVCKYYLTISKESQSTLKNVLYKTKNNKWIKGTMIYSFVSCVFNSYVLDTHFILRNQIKVFIFWNWCRYGRSFLKRKKIDLFQKGNVYWITALYVKVYLTHMVKVHVVATGLHVCKGYICLQV